MATLTFFRYVPTLEVQHNSEGIYANVFNTIESHKEELEGDVTGRCARWLKDHYGQIRVDVIDTSQFFDNFDNFKETLDKLHVEFILLGRNL